MADTHNEKVWPVLTLGNDRQYVHDSGAEAVDEFISQHDGAELLAVHTYTFTADEYHGEEYIYLGIVSTQQAVQP